MSVAANQQRTFLRLLAHLRPHWRRDPALPARINALLAANRGFGSRDRRLYRELIYTTLRYLPWIEPLLDTAPDAAVRRVAALATDSPATRLFRAAFDGDLPVPGDRTELLPAWFRAHCPELFVDPELATQLRRAPLWLRLQTDEAGESRVLAEFEARGWAARRSLSLPGALEVLTEADVTTTDSWKEGHFEVQDIGSQLILAGVGIERGETWLDACAGAGGKSLQLARLLGPTGQVEAHDIRPAALAELRTRMARAASSTRARAERSGGKDVSDETLQAGLRAAGFAPIRVAPEAPEREYDGVLVDAPCSGSGTWRRAPHLKWVTTAAQIEQAAERQRRLLVEFSRRVRPGGRLVYATCSLSRRENEDVVAAFLAAHPDFHAVALANTFGAREREGGLTIFPSRHDSDGFFVASLRRR